MGKINSIEEVNARIPEITHIFGRIEGLSEISLSVSRDIQALFDIWGNQLREANNPDHGLYHDKLSRKRTLNSEIQNAIGKIKELGGTVKDTQRGLVDFYFETSNGEGIYLCWKRGEKKITHWHPVRGRFTERRSLEELLQARSV